MHEPADETRRLAVPPHAAIPDIAGSEDHRQSERFAERCRTTRVVPMAMRQQERRRTHLEAGEGREDRGVRAGRPGIDEGEVAVVQRHEITVRAGNRAQSPDAVKDGFGNFVIVIHRPPVDRNR